MTDRDEKEVTKQAIKEWMDEQYAAFGRWTMKTLAIAALTSFIFWWVSIRGGKFP